MKSRFSVALGFLALIAIGTVVLASPWARNDGAWGPLMTSAFTACSAVCVTGLTVVDIASEFSFAGQIALLVLVEIGCLGLMTVSTFLMVAIGRRLSLSREFTLLNAYGVAEVRGVKGLICWVVGSMLVMEGAGAAVLYARLHDSYLSVFYSIMGFCNAGQIPHSIRERRRNDAGKAVHQRKKLMPHFRIRIHVQNLCKQFVLHGSARFRSRTVFCACQLVCSGTRQRITFQQDIHRDRRIILLCGSCL